MIKKLITITSVIALSCCFFGCKSDEEKCKEDRDVEACQRVLNKAADQVQKDLDNIKLP